MQRQIGLLVETSQQSAALARQKIGPLAAHRSGGWAARRTCPLGPFHHARDADIETHRHCPARQAVQKLPPQLAHANQENKLAPCKLASIPAHMLNQNYTDSGIPPIRPKSE